MKTILEYLYNRKGSIKSGIFIKNFDIVEINNILFIYLTDDAFEKINPEFRNLLYTRREDKDFTQGIFYNTRGWLSRADYDNDGLYNGNSNYDITKIWGNFGGIDFSKPDCVTPSKLLKLINSKNYKLIWER